MKNFFNVASVERERERGKKTLESRNCEKEWWKSKVLAMVNQAQVKLCKETWEMENEGKIERDGNRERRL